MPELGLELANLNVLFVCLGNICRSPMAAGVMRRIYEEQGLDGTVESAGTANWNVGQAADRRAIKVANEHGIDIRAHRARQVSVDDFFRFDIIFALDHQNQRDLQKLVPSRHWNKIRLLHEGTDISDPYSGDEDVFRRSFEIIEACCLEAVAQFGDFA